MPVISRRLRIDTLSIPTNNGTDVVAPCPRAPAFRRDSEGFAGLEITVSSPEDTILAKLRWAKLSGGSEKQFTDALRVYEVQYEELDLVYLRAWAKKLDIETLLNELETKAEVI